MGKDRSIHYPATAQNQWQKGCGALFLALCRQAQHLPFVLQKAELCQTVACGTDRVGLSLRWDHPQLTKSPEHIWRHQSNTQNTGGSNSAKHHLLKVGSSLPSGMFWWRQM